MSDGSRRGFFAELKRRNVYRVAIAYVVGAWLVIQVADTVFPYFGISADTISRLITLLAIGFVPALILSWLFEWTPAGIEVDEDAGRRARPTVQGRRKIDYAIIIMLTIAVGLFSYDRFVTPLGGVTVIANANPSIAVLPFENRSALDDDVFFVDGVHDDILIGLGKIESLDVISRTSVERYRNTNKSIREIGAELGVTSIIEGGVQRAGDRIRINVQLIDVGTDVNQWSQSYERELTTANIFAIQSEIADTIARALQTTLLPEERLRIAAVPTENLEAYEAYLLGNQRLRQRGVAVEDAARYFQDAIDLDADFALAYVGLADSYQLMGTHTNRRWEELRPLAMAAAEKAIELDPNLGEAYISLAMIHHESRESDLAGPLFVRGLELSPNYATGRQWYSEYLGDTGNLEAELEQIELALRLDPLSPIINHIYAGRLRNRGDLRGAEAVWKKTLERNPDFSRGYQGLSVLYFRDLGQLDDAAIIVRKATLLNPQSASNFALLANIFLSLGDIEQAESWVAEANRLNPSHFDSRLVTASILVARDRWEEAAELSRTALRGFARAGQHVWMLSTHHFRAGRFDEALAVFEGGWPRLVEENIATVHVQDVAMAAHVIRILQEMGETDRADRLLDEARRAYEANLDTGVYLGLLTDVRLLALAGERDQAIAALQREVDSGWRFQTQNTLERSTTFDAIRDDPAFKAIAEAVNADLARQRESLKEKWTAEFD